MCMIDDAEPSTFQATYRHRARTAKKCGDCRRLIQPGEYYGRHTGLSDGRFWTARTCAHCDAAGEWLIQTCHGYLYGNVLEDLEEHWRYGSGSRSMLLGRLIVGMRNQWKRKGGLLPVPNANYVRAVASITYAG